MTVHIFGGGTIAHVRSHFQLASYSKGTTAKNLAAALREELPSKQVKLHLTSFADLDSLMLTVEQVRDRLLEVLADASTQVIVMSAAICDAQGQIGDIPSGKRAARLQSRDLPMAMTLSVAPKLLAEIKARRPDVTLIGFKTTCDEPPEVQLSKANRQVKEAGADYVLANDIGTYHNLLISGSGSVECEGQRSAVLAKLIDLIIQQVKD